MAFMSGDRRSVIDAGGNSVCAECGELSIGFGLVDQHTEGCSQSESTDSVSGGSVTARRANDPNVYVMTDKGIERAIDVDRRRKRRR